MLQSETVDEMELVQFGEVMEKYFDVRYEFVGEEMRPRFTGSAINSWLWPRLGVTYRTYAVTFSGRSLDASGAEHETIQILVHQCGTYLSPRTIKHILARFKVPTADFYEAYAFGQGRNS